MKKTITICLLIIFSGILFSCSDTKRKDGDWDDNIKLSSKSVEFNASADSVIITTEGTGWWISNVSVNNTYYQLSPDIKVESKHYSFKKDCFVVERRDKNTLFIRLDANQLPVKRIFSVELEAGDYFDRILIIQKAKL